MRRALALEGRASFRWRDSERTAGNFHIGQRTFAVIHAGPVAEHGGTLAGWLGFNPEWVVLDVTTRRKVFVARVRTWRSAFARAAWYAVNADDLAAVGAT